MRLLGYGEHDGILFYSMELIDGPSLEQEINNGRRFDWNETLGLSVQLCRALKHAHDHGVVHRDVKPANLLLTADNRVKVADFGIARVVEGEKAGPGTRPGEIIGSARYMSPEQLQGEETTPRSDLYSAGILLYHCLTGRPPFAADDARSSSSRHRSATLSPPSAHRSEISRDVDELAHPKRMYDLAEGLIRRKYTDAQIEGVLGGNFKRVLGQIWTA